MDVLELTKDEVAELLGLPASEVETCIRCGLPARRPGIFDGQVSLHWYVGWRTAEHMSLRATEPLHVTLLGYLSAAQADNRKLNLDHLLERLQLSFKGLTRESLASAYRYVRSRLDSQGTAKWQASRTTS